jgi:hypothetical protein
MGRIFSLKAVGKEDAPPTPMNIEKIDVYIYR